MKNLKKNAFVLVGITLVVLYFVLKDDFGNIVDNLLKANLWWILVAFFCYLLYLIFKSMVLYITVKKEVPHYSFKRAIKHNMITQFFNGVTPFSTGGQPMEIYMLHKQGVSYSKSTNIILQTFLFYQTALVLYGAIAVFLNYYFSIFAKVPLLRKLILIGFLINTIVVIFLFVVSFAKKLNGFIIKKVLHLLAKLKMIKQEEEQRNKWNQRLEEFHACATNLKKHKMLFVKGVLYHFLSLTFYYIIPLFLAFSMNDFHSLTWLNTLVASAYVLIIGSFVPIPGASGGIEYGFLAFFGNFLSGSILPAILLIWRFITYYLGMILGAFIFSFDKGDDQK